MKMRIVPVLVFGLLLCGTPLAHAAEGQYERGYWSQLGRTFSRGARNVVGSPWEIPYTIQKHDQTDDGNPRLFRDTAGLFDGIFRTVTRFGSGAWDMAWAFVPGSQEGLSLEPETFF